MNALYFRLWLSLQCHQFTAVTDFHADSQSESFYTFHTNFIMC